MNSYYYSVLSLLLLTVGASVVSPLHCAQKNAIFSNKWMRRGVIGGVLYGCYYLRETYHHRKAMAHHQEFIQHLKKGDFDFLLNHIESFSLLSPTLREAIMQSYKEYMIHSGQAPLDKVICCTQNIDRVIRCHNKVEEGGWKNGVSARREIKTSLDQIRDEIGKSLPPAPSLGGKQSAGPSRVGWGS